MAVYSNENPDSFEEVKLERLERTEKEDVSSYNESHDDKERKSHKGNILMLITFILELIILAFVVVLAYFLRWTSIFPIRKVDFNCNDPNIAYSTKHSTFSDFALDASVPDVVVYALSFCVPPFVICVGEIGVWAFTSEKQKSVTLLCRGCNIPQVVRRLIRFISVFLFGGFTLMIFVDVLKLMTGRLRPNFLEICDPNRSFCNNITHYGDDLCSEQDVMTLRNARTSFPSLFSALTAYSSVFTSIYIHGALRTRAVRILRPFLAFAFTVLALLCGLSEIGLSKSFWTDVVVGFGMGIVCAVYLGTVVLCNFREYVSERRVISLLHNFLMDHQLLNELEQEGIIHMGMFSTHDLHIPRAHMRRSSKYDDTEDMKRRADMYDTFQKDLSRTVDHYRDRRNSRHSQVQPISHL